MTLVIRCNKSLSLSCKVAERARTYGGTLISDLTRAQAIFESFEIQPLGRHSEDVKFFQHSQGGSLESQSLSTAGLQCFWCPL